MKTYNEFKSNTTIGGLFGKLFAARQQAHILHLGTKSFAEHKALGKLYEDLNDLIDDLIETYQGQYGLVNIETTSISTKNALEFVAELASECSECHSLFDKKDTHLHNIIDEITALVYRVHYVVKFLK
jgi:hypothetical protein